MKFVIIGGGIAGTTAAEELRKQDENAEITIIEQEPHRLYTKVLLAKYVTGELERERLFLKTQEWYEKKSIELMTETRVLSIDTKNKFVLTSEKREIPYDKLIIATGQQPRMLETDMRGIVYFRTLDDAEILKSLIAELQARPREEQRMIIIGGGFIAMEYLHIAHALSIPTSVVLRSDSFWSKGLSAESKEMLLKKAHDLGFDVHTNQGFEILGENEFEGVKLANGKQIKGSILAVGVGIETDGQWLVESGLDIESGLVCNSELAVAEDIYTVGDISEFEDGIMDRVMHVGNWTNAIMQGKCAAKNALGVDETYAFVSSYATRLGGIEISFIGDTNRSKAQNVQRIVDQETVFELLERNGRTVGAVVFGGAKERTAITKAIQNKELYEHKTSTR